MHKSSPLKWESLIITVFLVKNIRLGAVIGVHHSNYFFTKFVIALARLIVSAI